MTRTCLLGIFALVACIGCTSATLENFTLRQIQSNVDNRDEMVMDCLATVAADPNTFPSYSLVPYGITTVTDSFTLSDAVTMALGKLTTQGLGLNVNRQPKGQWTLDPVVEYERLAALHAACLWVLCDENHLPDAPPEILGYQEDYQDKKPHFGVAKRLANIPHGWAHVHVGRSRDVPTCARYKGHCGNTWVWVMPKDAEAFAQFTLVLQDIATLDDTAVYSPPLLVLMNTYELTRLTDVSDPAKIATISTSEWRAVKPEYKATIEKAIQDGLNNGKVDLTRAQWLAFTDPWLGVRTPTGTPSSSQTARAGAIQLNPGGPTSTAPTGRLPPATVPREE